MRFSERNGYKPVRQIIQKDNMDESLKIGIWNVFHTCLWDRAFNYQESFYTYDSNLVELIKSYWANIFKLPLDLIPRDFEDTLQEIRNRFFKLKWYEIYDLIENTLENYPNYYVQPNFKFIDDINNTLENEKAAYRIIQNQITEITSEQEIKSIEEALEKSHSYSGVQQHLNQALKLMSDRQNPDYRNSIKESISAVESICKIITKNDKASLGQALKLIEDKYGLHEALKKSLSQLYGYTSDGDGIRHAMLEESNLSYIDAKFMLVACTNFINYLIDKTKDQ